MSSTQDKLVRMANQIAIEFENQRDTDPATATWDHIWHFWDPRMCVQIIAHLASGGQDLNDTARRAIKMLRDKGDAPSQTPATDFAAGLSDAG